VPRAGKKGRVLIDAEHPLLLASASPRRRELLAGAGVPIVSTTVAVDETPNPRDAAEAYLDRVVADKLAAALLIRDTRCNVVLVADTIVVVDSRFLGKPRDDQQARVMVSTLQGREHTVLTRFAWRVVDGERHHAATMKTTVWFRSLDTPHIARYVSTGEGRDKAGAYAIQGIGAMLVTRIEGSYTNVMGLPLAEVIASLQSAGLLGPVPLRNVVVTPR
jgi:septum formation protein